MTNNTASPQKKPTRLGLSSRRWLIGIPVCIALVTVAFQVVFFQRDNSNQDLLAGRAEFRIVQDSARLTAAETTHDAASPSSVIPSACPSSSPSAAPSMSPSASPAAAMDQMYDAQSYALYDDSSSAAKAKGLGRARLLSMESYGKYLLSDSFDSDKRYQYHHGDQFQSVEDNSIKKTMSEPVSTFSVDVDTSSYSYVRRLLKDWRLPPRDAVKVEEFINYFDYEYPQPPNREVPFEATVAVSKSPWHKGQKLLHIGIKGYGMDPSDRPYSNLVFLVDVSGSMGNIDRLPLAKEAMEMLLNTMQPEDLVSIVTYASNVNVPLPPTPVADKKHILSVLNSLSASGSTWGTGGIEKAYELAEKNFDKDAVNRIMLLTDGDFNIGLMDNYSLKTYIETKRETGIFLSVLGFGMGNYKDDFMKSLANNGNGVAAYVDSLEEAHKVMVTEASSTMFPIAKVSLLEYRMFVATLNNFPFPNTENTCPALDRMSKSKSNSILPRSRNIASWAMKSVFSAVKTLTTTKWMPRILAQDMRSLRCMRLSLLGGKKRLEWTSCATHNRSSRSRMPPQSWDKSTPLSRCDTNFRMKTNPSSYPRLPQWKMKWTALQKSMIHRCMLPPQSSSLQRRWRVLLSYSRAKPRWTALATAVF